MLDRQLIERIAGAFPTDEVLVEKDWYIVHAIRIIASLDHAGATPVFSGGTSLSKGWGLIKRFSEDIDFKAEEIRSIQAQQATAMQKAEAAFDALLARTFNESCEGAHGTE